MGSREGILKIAAMRSGIPICEYKKRIANGEKWCHGCRSWHPVSAFGKDSSRGDGLSAICRDCRKRRAKERYIPVLKHERKKPGPKRIPRRDGDKLQARSRINHDVELGIIPNPNEMRCTDCGHLGRDRRHEYDHFLGYAKEHHYDVEVVCSRCHSRRAAERGEAWYSKGR